MSEQVTEITRETYPNVLAMANSPDKENQIVALSLVENLDYKKNLIFILILKKQSNITADTWKEHAPTVYKKMSTSGIDPDQIISYKKVLNVLLDNKASEDHIQFYLDSFAEHMKSSIRNIGYEYVDDLQITIKLKKDDKTGSTGKGIKSADKS